MITDPKAMLLLGFTTVLIVIILIILYWDRGKQHENKKTINEGK